MRGARLGLMRLDDALAALGDQGSMGHYDDEVPLAAIVGSVARADDFDPDFAPRARTERLRRVEQLFEETVSPPPIEVVRLGELYFVSDGHHRVSVARARGWDLLPARVRRICTVAYALCCLRVADLPAKAAERRFLERVPLPAEVGRGLSVSPPASWARLADAAQAWGSRHGYPSGRADSAHALAAAWWEEEVRPVVDALRAEGPGLDLDDVQLYVTALAARDRLGALDWPDGLGGAAAIDACCGLDPAEAESHDPRVHSVED